MIETIPLLIGSFCWLAGFALMWRIPLCARRNETQKADKVSVIIPARNEEKRLPALLNTLSHQSVSPGEIIVVDDDSEDNTAEIAAKFNASIVRIEDKPVGWNGKSFACWTGAQKSSGELLLFLDADTELEPDGLARILSEHSNEGGLISVQPWHITRKPYEQLSAFLNIIVMAGLNTFTVLGKRLSPAGSFGPCIMCSREDYFSTGGHEAVKAEILEDIPFGRNFLKKGKPVNCYGGRNTIKFRMYPDGLADLIGGWSKSFAAGASHTRPFITILVAVWVSGAFTAASQLIFAPSLAGLLMYACYVLQIYLLQKYAGNFGRFTALLYPVSIAFFVFISIKSLITTFVFKTVTWKGRPVHTDV
ncbi:MAG: glycosyltransferase family 2 protein [Fibrobacteria bacterium]|nr:glycosyltransferase family 2 protein [Fibrobacteria bacterium]